MTGKAEKTRETVAVINRARHCKWLMISENTSQG